MQYVYFGLMPFLLGAWFVYRENYKIDSSPDPLSRKDYRNTNIFLYLFLFTAIYIWRFSLAAGLMTAMAVLVIRGVWNAALKSSKHKSRLG